MGFAPRLERPRVELKRREFLATVAAGSACVGNLQGSSTGQIAHQTQVGQPVLTPHLDMFPDSAGQSFSQQIACLHARGFRAIDDSRLASRDVESQAEIGQAARQHGMHVGQFAGCVSFGEPLFASGRADDWRKVLAELNQALQVAQRTGARYCTVVPGLAESTTSRKRQFRNARLLLAECSQLFATTGVTLLLESCRHPSPQRRMLFEDVHTACRMCQSLSTPTCRVMLDTCCHRLQPIYDLLASPLARCVGYIQLGDFPGRKEPGTGRIDFQQLLSKINNSGFAGPLAMDHGCSLPGQLGEQRVLAAYRRLQAGQRAKSGSRQQPTSI